MTLNCMLTDIVNLLYNKQNMYTKQGSRSTEIEMKKDRKKQDIKKWGEKQQLNSLWEFPFTKELSIHLQTIKCTEWIPLTLFSLIC